MRKAINCWIVGLTDPLLDLVPEPGVVFLRFTPALHRIAHEHAQELRGRVLLRCGNLGERGLEFLVDTKRKGAVSHPRTPRRVCSQQGTR